MFIVIGGATASGKSGLAIEVAKRTNGEIIGADSMQIYKKMDVGTAKVTEEETQGVVHHLIDVVEPNETFSVAQYEKLAKTAIKDIENRGKTPIVCGGTGLYINSLIYDYQMSAYDPKLRENLMRELDEKGLDYMYEKLLKLDPLAENIHKNNVKRVIRALEVYLTEGKSVLDKNDKASTVPHLMYAVDMPREVLYERINLRVDKMFADGLEDEVNSLIENEKLTFDMQSMQAIGYKEFNGYLNGEYDKNTLTELIKQHSRNYAKRQITWFKRIDSCKWLNCAENNDFITQIANDYYKNITKI